MEVNSPAPAPPPKVSKPPKESVAARFFKSVKTLLLIILLLLALLWNWDGFWQTNLGFLRNSQERYFPAKVAEEQQKLRNVELHNSEHEQLLARVQTLETQGASALELKQKSYLDAALQIIETLSSKLPPEQVEEVRGNCTSQECAEIFTKGRALLE